MLRYFVKAFYLREQEVKSIEYGQFYSHGEFIRKYKVHILDKNNILWYIDAYHCPIKCSRNEISRKNNGESWSQQTIYCPR